jgi:hypothetical protein
MAQRKSGAQECHPPRGAGHAGDVDLRRGSTRAAVVTASTATEISGPDRCSGPCRCLSAPAPKCRERQGWPARVTDRTTKPQPMMAVPAAIMRTPPRCARCPERCDTRKNTRAQVSSARPAAFGPSKPESAKRAQQKNHAVDPEGHAGGGDECAAERPVAEQPNGTRAASPAWSSGENIQAWPPRWRSIAANTRPPPPSRAPK